MALPLSRSTIPTPPAHSQNIRVVALLSVAQMSSSNSGFMKCLIYLKYIFVNVLLYGTLIPIDHVSIYWNIPQSIRVNLVMM